MSFSVNETNSKVTVTEPVTELVVEDKAARVTVSADNTQVEITSPGPQGPVGPGVPVGGATNDVLVKLSATQYDTAWSDEITVDQINFDTGAGEDLTAPGQMAWDADFGTFDSVLSNGADLVTMHVGQDIYYRVVNNTASTIAKGKLVMAVAGPGSSGKIAIQLAVADGSVPSQYLMGITAQSIAAGADGFVVHFGKVRKLDTQTPDWNIGDILWADPATPGGLTKVEPAAPNSRTIVAIVLSRNQSNGQIFVRPTYGHDIADDERVTLTNVTGGQTLLYNGTVGVFENATLTASDVSGVVPTTRNLTASTGLSGGGDLSADRSFAVLYGTTAGTAAEGDDARLSDARTPLAHATTHHTGGSDPLTATNIGAVPEARQVISGTGLTGGGDLTADRTLTVLYGTTSGTAASGDDARLSDARTPLAHASTHHTGGTDALTATNIGAAEATRQVIAGTGLSGGGDLTADRTLTVLYGTTSGTAAAGDDARLSDARTPTAHASTHFTGGSDPITATNIGAAQATTQILAGTALTGGGTLEADRTLNVLIGTTSGAVASGDRGLPTGGTEGQFLVKDSATDYDASWQTDPLWPTLSSGDFISQPARIFSGSAPALNTMFLTPFLLRSTTTFDGIGYYQWNANTTAGANVRLGVYEADTYKKPGGLLLDAGTLTFASPGFTHYLQSINLTLAPGLYFMAFVPQGNAQNGTVGQGEAFGSWVRASYGATGNDANRGIMYTYVKTGVSGALPDPVVDPVALNVSSSRIYMRVA